VPTPDEKRNGFKIRFPTVKLEFPGPNAVIENVVGKVVEKPVANPVVASEIFKFRAVEKLMFCVEIKLGKLDVTRIVVDKPTFITGVM
jgi:hypothetical protein